MSSQINKLIKDNPKWIRTSNHVLVGMGVFFFAMLFMPWMQTVTGEGRVVAFDAQERRQELSAPMDGRIQKWSVKEGDRVKKGDVILEMADNDPLILDRMSKERDSLEKKFEAIELGRQTSAINVKRQKELYDQGLSSRRQYELAKMELAKLESEEASALADMSRIDVRLSRQQQQVISAPIDGTVVRILKNSVAGVDYVNAGEPLAIIVPDTSSRIVEVWISGNDIPWVTAGKEVALQFEGWPTIQFSGLPQISVGTFFGIVKLVDALDDGNGNFRILVSPKDDKDWPSPDFLRQGVRAYAWVMLGDVPLGYEIWRRFNGFPPSNLPQGVYQTTEKKKKKEKKDDFSEASSK
jgi:biotin carboxyl carrier protein